MTRRAISNNHFSHDIQVDDAVNTLTARKRKKFFKEFPEYLELTWEGSWVNTKASGIDIEYMSWVTDWIENNTKIYWEDGEPWLR